MANKLSVALLCCVATHAVGQSKYAVVDTWKIGGTGGWDYATVDSTAHRLYVTHNVSVDVVDTTTGKVVGSIAGLKGTHGVALDPEGKFGYISDGRGNAVVVFDRETLATVATVGAGTNPDGILFEPHTKTVWAFNGTSKNVTVIDAASRKVVSTIALPGKPEFPQADGNGTVFVNIEDRNTVVKLDATAKNITATWPLTGCDSPSGMAMDVAGQRLFSVCDGKKMPVTDAKTGKQIALVPIGDGPDAAGYDAKDGLAFSSNGEGTLTVVDTSHGYSTETVTTVRGARTMAYDAASDRVYLPSAEYGATPAATASVPHPRPAIVPGSFAIVVVGRK